MQSRSQRQEAGTNRHWELNERAPVERDLEGARAMSVATAGSLCTCCVIGILALGWCILDHWNRQISSDLFDLGDTRLIDTNGDGIPEAASPFQRFTYPLTLAFLQFLAMGVFFTMLYISIGTGRLQDVAQLSITSDKRWTALATTHVCSTFYLQTLVLPARVLSVGLFAASRAAELPIAAALRSLSLGSRKDLRTVVLASAAACTMFFAYAQISGCVCIWSGKGIALSGAAFWMLYLMFLGMPAGNAVLQESIMLQPGLPHVDPFLLLAIQNMLACVVFAPFLLLCHCLGVEDVKAAVAMFQEYSEVDMLAVWLCVQTAVSSVLCVTLIHMADSFWTIALRSLRVVLWAAGSLCSFYLTRQNSLSVLSPRTSAWSLVLLFGACLGAFAMHTDRVYRNDLDSNPPEKKGYAKSLTRGSHQC